MWGMWEERCCYLGDQIMKENRGAEMIPGGSINEERTSVSVHGEDGSEGGHCKVAIRTQSQAVIGNAQ